MARTALTPQQISTAGLTPAFVAATADGIYIPNNDGRIYVEAINTGAVAVLTAQTPVTVGGLAVSESTCTVPATTGRKKFGPFPPSIFNQADGSVYVDCDVPAGVTWGAFRL